MGSVHACPADVAEAPVRHALFVQTSLSRIVLGYPVRMFHVKRIGP